MKTKLLNAAIEDLVMLSGANQDCMDWVVEMHGALLIHVGKDRDTLLWTAEPDERTRIMQEIGEDKKLDTGNLENIVFVFGGDIYPETFLHALRDGNSWCLRLAHSSRKGFSFCPVQGVLDLDCTGLDVEAWPLGGVFNGDSNVPVFLLFNYALTAFSRLHGYSQRKRHYCSETLNLSNTGLAKAA